MSDLTVDYEARYEELAEMYPRFYRDVYEMTEIWKAHCTLITGIDAGLDQMIDNCFVDTADEDTIEILENYLGLALLKERTLEERRTLIRNYIAGTGRVSATRIITLIESYTGASCECTFLIGDDEGNCILEIIFDRGDQETLYWSDIYTLLSKMLPAHIAYNVTMRMNEYAIAVSADRTHCVSLYQACGTQPETALIADINTADTATDTGAAAANYSMDYLPCGLFAASAG